MGRVLGLDYGQRRVGLALSDSRRTVVTPLRTVDRKREDLWQVLEDLLTTYPIDVIWPALAAPHALDLSPYVSPEDWEDFSPVYRDNNRVEGKLVALPFYADAGLLYYRKDLLEAYGYDHPPRTWAELEAMAQHIQNEERARGDRDFWGFVWQGQRYEGLTCNVLEWVASHGGGTLVDARGRVTLDNPAAIRALARARRWVGWISPPGVTAYIEEDARNLFQSGHVLFMRNWPYAYALLSAPESPVRGKFGITVLPRGEGEGGRHAVTLGGWQLMVSRYSRHPEEAVALVRYLTSAEVQKRRARDMSLLPTRRSVYADPEIQKLRPWWTVARKVLRSAVARPSSVAGRQYNRVSQAVFDGVHRVLTGTWSPEEAVKRISRRIQQALRRRR
ncbi:MAG: Holliday junction resolvase RuvX [Candidatus Hydrothermae bacterium]|nr:Holliday junction resolvase RuvX [Candidatus Hydrothermae bacterium]